MREDLLERHSELHPVFDLSRDGFVRRLRLHLHAENELVIDSQWRAAAHWAP